MNFIKNLIRRWKWYRMTPEQRAEETFQAMLRVSEMNARRIEENWGVSLFSRGEK